MVDGDDHAVLCADGLLVEIGKHVLGALLGSGLERGCERGAGEGGEDGKDGPSIHGCGDRITRNEGGGVGSCQPGRSGLGAVLPLQYGVCEPGLEFVGAWN